MMQAIEIVRLIAGIPALLRHAAFAMDPGGIALGLFAQSDAARWEGVAKSFRTRPRTELDGQIPMLLLLGAVLALWLFSQWHGRRTAGQPYDSPRRLFDELCSEHRLDWRSRWLLWRLARAHRLKHPARVFLDRDFFRVESIPPALRVHGDTLSRLERRLFAGEGDSLEGARRAAEGAAARGAAVSSEVASSTAPEATAPGASPLLAVARSPQLDVGPWIQSQASATDAPLLPR